MDVIANRKTAGLITGDIRVSGHPMEPRTFARISGCELGSRGLSRHQ